MQSCSQARCSSIRPRILHLPPECGQLSSVERSLWTEEEAHTWWRGLNWVNPGAKFCWQRTFKQSLPCPCSASATLSRRLCPGRMHSTWLNRMKFYMHLQIGLFDFTSEMGAGLGVMEKPLVEFEIPEPVTRSTNMSVTYFCKYNRITTTEVPTRHELQKVFAETFRAGLILLVGMVILMKLEFEMLSRKYISRIRAPFLKHVLDGCGTLNSPVDPSSGQSNKLAKDSSHPQ